MSDRRQIESRFSLEFGGLRLCEFLELRHMLNFTILISAYFLLPNSQIPITAVVSNWETLSCLPSPIVYYSSHEILCNGFCVCPRSQGLTTAESATGAVGWDQNTQSWQFVLRGAWGCDRLCMPSWERSLRGDPEPRNISSSSHLLSGRNRERLRWHRKQTWGLRSVSPSIASFSFHSPVQIHTFRRLSWMATGCREDRRRNEVRGQSSSSPRLLSTGEICEEKYNPSYTERMETATTLRPLSRKGNQSSLWTRRRPEDRGIPSLDRAPAIHSETGPKPNEFPPLPNVQRVIGGRMGEVRLIFAHSHRLISPAFQR